MEFAFFRLKTALFWLAQPRLSKMLRKETPLQEAWVLLYRWRNRQSNFTSWLLQKNKETKKIGKIQAQIRTHKTREAKKKRRKETPENTGWRAKEIKKGHRRTA